MILIDRVLVPSQPPCWIVFIAARLKAGAQSLTWSLAQLPWGAESRKATGPAACRQSCCWGLIFSGGIPSQLSLLMGVGSGQEEQGVGDRELALV